MGVNLVQVVEEVEPGGFDWVSTKSYPIKDDETTEETA